MVFKDFVHLWSHKNWIQVNRGKNPNPTTVQLCPFSPPIEHFTVYVNSLEKLLDKVQLQSFLDTGQMKEISYMCVHIHMYI